MYYSTKKWTVFLFLVLCSIGGYAQRINVATFNVRNDNNRQDAAQGDGWKQRYPVIASLILFHEFDIFGTQEALHHQLEDLKSTLPHYAYIGKGRDDGKEAGEYSAIFYNMDKFKVLEEGNFWLSPNTEVPNKGWDAVLPRICSWAKFQSKENGKTLYFFNVHFDHVGKVARSESAKLILEKVKALAGNHTSILTGDFNVDQQSDSYLLLNNSGILQDAYTQAHLVYALNGTFNSFDPNKKTDSRIDHIFLTKDFEVLKYGVLTDTYRSAGKDASQGDRARTPSDHFPVMATIVLP